MKPYCWTSIKILIITLILALPARGEIKANMIRHTRIMVAQNSNNENDSILISRDKVYNQLLKTLESYKAVWKQQPSNIPALKRYNREVQDQVTLLRSIDHKGKPSTRSTPTGELTSSSAIVKAPADTSIPSSKPSSEGEIEKRKQATDIFLSGPIDNSKVFTTIQEVPETRIDTSCELAEIELTKLNALLIVVPLDQDAFTKTLEKLHTILNHLSQSTSATSPKSPE